MNFSLLIRSFAKTRSSIRGRAVHGKMIASGMHPDVYTSNHLISMYSQFDRIGDARQVFDHMSERNLVSWTTLISSYSKMGLAVDALDCLRLMVGDGFDPNHYTYVSVVSACASLGAERIGKEVHGRILRCELELNSFVCNSLVNFYGKCGFLKSAVAVFDAILEPNQVSWTSLLSCACQSGENLEGLKIFFWYQKAGVMVNEFSCASVLGACVALEYLEFGMQVHAIAVKCGVRLDHFVVTGLVNLYAKCGALDLARQVFREVDKPHMTAWTALIGGCVQQGKGREAIDLFCQLYSLDVKPSERTFASVLGAFSDAMEINVGKQLHSLILKLGFSSFTFVANAVLDFYSKCGFLEGTLKTFKEMDVHDVVTWNTVIAAYVNSGNYEEAVKFLREMLLEGFDLSLYTYSSILSICGDLPAVQWGKQTHCRIIKPSFDSNVVVGSALIDMYAKCGRLCDARKVFDNLSSKNLVSWNTMLVGYAQHGYGIEALAIYNMMLAFGVKPNDVTFLGVLSACGHVGLLEEGLYHFHSMTKDHGITPRTDHLACMVSIFARKGQTKGAFEFIRSYPMEPNKVVWRCLLSGCKTHRDFDIGIYAAKEILSIDPDDISAYITLSNMYAESKMWNETAKVRKLIKDKALQKDPGYSWTELKSKTYSFSSGHNNVHLQGNDAVESLTGLTEQLIDAGYVPGAVLSLACEEWNGMDMDPE